jgi:hypothetical protein
MQSQTALRVGYPWRLAPSCRVSALAYNTLTTPFNAHERGNSHTNASARPDPTMSRSLQGRPVYGGGNVSKIVDANVERCRNADSDLLYPAPLRPPRHPQEATRLNGLPINYPVQSGLVGRVNKWR